MIDMSCVVEVGPDGVVRLPKELCEKLGLKAGQLVKVINKGNDELFITPVKSIMELFGVDAEHKNVLLEAVREIERERREEALK